MTIPNNFVFTPADGVRNVSDFPTVPDSEADLRNAVQTPSDQLRDFINNDLLLSLGTSMNLAGATAPTRYVGGTTSGAPTTGTFEVGDFVIDQSGYIWVCTVAGTPGTWMGPTPHSQSRVDIFRGSINTTSTSGISIPIATAGLMPFQFKASEWTKNQFYLEVTTGVSGGFGYLSVYDLTSSINLSSTQISFTVNGVYRSTTFSLTDGHNYAVFIKSGGPTTYLYAADIVQLL